MSSSVAACRAVARASRSPRSPVQAFAQPELQTTARIVGDSRKCAALTSKGAALISLVVTTEAQLCGASKTTKAKSRLRGLIPRGLREPHAGNGSQAAAQRD